MRDILSDLRRHPRYTLQAVEYIFTWYHGSQSVQINDAHSSSCAVFVPVGAAVDGIPVFSVVVAVLAAEDDAGAGTAENVVASGNVDASHSRMKPFTSVGRSS